MTPRGPELNTDIEHQPGEQGLTALEIELLSLRAAAGFALREFEGLLTPDPCHCQRCKRHHNAMRVLREALRP